MTLADEGSRFVIRDGKAEWVHPAEKRATDIDCTDMTDAEFEWTITMEKAA